MNAPQMNIGKAFDPTGLVLPAGFVWVRLDQIDRSLDGGGFENADRFTKGQADFTPQVRLESVFISAG